MRAKAFIIFVVVLTLYLQITAVSASEIILEDADTVWNTTTAYSEELANVTSDVKTRIQTEYANTIYHNNLNPSTDLFNVTTNVTPRILTEYANTIYHNELKEIPAGLANITGEVPPKITIVHANSNCYEALTFPKELIHDTTSPLITNVIVTGITNNSATLEWDTDEIADSLVKYGKTSGSYIESEGDSLFVNNHAIELTGLLPGTSYYFVVNSTDQTGNTKESIEQGFVTIGGLKVFDTGASEKPYPSISGTHNGTITPNQTISVSKLYTYPCEGTGGHSEYIRIWNSTLDVNATWEGYEEDWHNLSFDEQFTLVAGETYNYCIRTGSYPQIYHTGVLPTTNGWINCTEFVDANGKSYNDWIPAIKLFSKIKLFSEVPLTAADNGTLIELKKGQSLSITLEAYPTTGYTWYLVELPNEHILRQVGEIEFNQESDLVGAGGVQIVRFDGVSTGQTALKLVYHRPWETDVPPEEIFYIQVVIRG